MQEKQFADNEIIREIPPVIRQDMTEIFASLGPLRESLRGKTVLITGAYGMLASYLVWFLIYLNEEHAGLPVHILALGRSREKFQTRFGAYTQKPYISFLEHDLSKPITVKESVDYMIHAASHADPRMYGQKPADVMLPNLLGTHYSLELAREKRVSAYLFFSSGEVYGKAPAEIVGEHDFGPYDPTLLRSVYGESKRAGEALCVSYAKQYGVPAKIVRPSHSFGPTMDVWHDSRVFAAFVKNVLAGEDIVMRSDGKASRCFIYLRDAAEAYLRVLLAGGAGEAYNVTNPNGKMSVAELAQLLAALSLAVNGKSLAVVTTVEDANIPARGDAVYSMMDVEKLTALGWQAQVSVREGFQRTLCHFLSRANAPGQV